MAHLPLQSEGLINWFRSLFKYTPPAAHDEVTAEIVQLLSGTDGIAGICAERFSFVLRNFSEMLLRARRPLQFSRGQHPRRRCTIKVPCLNLGIGRLALVRNGAAVRYHFSLRPTDNRGYGDFIGPKARMFEDRAMKRIFFLVAAPYATTALAHAQPFSPDDRNVETG